MKGDQIPFQDKYRCSKFKYSIGEVFDDSQNNLPYEHEINEFVSQKLEATTNSMHSNFETYL